MKSVETIKLSANGLDFTALMAGQGPLLLCLHGFPDNAKSFRFQFEALAGAGYRVVAPYMRGYAPTQACPRGRYQSAVLSRDVIALIDALGADKAHVLGHDWGAVAAYGAALAEPSRFESLIAAAVPYGPAVGQALMSDFDQQKRSWYMYFFQTPFAEAALAHEDFAFIKHLWRDWSPDYHCPDADMEALIETFKEPGVVEAALGYYRCMFQPELQDPALADEQMQFGFAPIAVRTLYLHGANDGCIGGYLAAGMEEMLPAGLTKVTIEGAGHFMHVEKPDEVNRAVMEFLAR